MTQTYASFGQALRALREERGFDYHDVAERSGVAKAKVRDWEDNKTRPSHGHLKRLFGVFRQLENFRHLLDAPLLLPPIRRPDQPTPASALQRMNWAKDHWRKDPDIPVGGPDGMIARMTETFGDAAAIHVLQALRSQVRHEALQRQTQPLTASLAERVNATQSSLARPSQVLVPLRPPEGWVRPPEPSPVATTDAIQAPPKALPVLLEAPQASTSFLPSPVAHPPARPEPMTIAPDRYGRDLPHEIHRREQRFFEIACQHPEWSQRLVNDQVRTELGWGVQPATKRKLMAKARGIRPGTQTNRATWGKARRHQEKNPTRVAPFAARPTVSSRPAPAGSSRRTPPASSRRRTPDGSHPRSTPDMEIRVAYAYQVVQPEQSRDDLRELVRQKFGVGIAAASAAEIIHRARQLAAGLRRTRPELGPSPAPSPPPTRATRTVQASVGPPPVRAAGAGRQSEIETAFQLLLETLPDLRTVEITADGTIQYTEIEPTERRSQLSLPNGATSGALRRTP